MLARYISDLRRRFVNTIVTGLFMWKEYLTTTNNYLFTLVESNTELNTRQHVRAILEGVVHADKSQRHSKDQERTYFESRYETIRDAERKEEVKSW